VQGIAEACGVVDEEVISPTFVLCREYHGKRTIYHADAYRVRDEDEFLALGAEEWFQSSALTFIEWAEKIVRCLPADYLVIELLVTGETSRRALLHVVGVELKSCLQQIVERYTS
jgi:tRNA threonylcarbamoyladenosine biosynthesis protein TsaE